jgi:hypothetical protein
MSAKLTAYQDAYDRDEAEAERLIQEYYATDMQAFFECQQWYVDLVPPPSLREPAAPPED